LCLAEVNLATGQYYHHEKVSLAKGVYLTLTYNSGNQFKGLWGKNWCSNLDQAINVKTKKLIYCGQKKNSISVKNNKNLYHYQLGSKKYFFSKNGKLMRACFSNKCFNLKFNTKIITMKQKENNIKLIRNNRGYVTFLNSGKYKYTFYYKNKVLNRLKQDRPFNLKKYFYESNKLVKLENSKGQHLNIKYKHNMVKSVIDSKGCVEKFNYTRLTSKKIETHTENSCQNRKQAFVYDFFSDYKIKRLKNIKNDDTFVFDKNQKLVKKTDFENTDVIFGKNKKINIIKKGNESAKVNYDRSSQVVSINYSENKKNNVNFEYENKKIKKIKTQSKFIAKFNYKSRRPSSIKTSRGETLVYNYKNKKLSSLMLLSKNKKFKFKMKNNKSKKAAIEITKFYNTIYGSMGFAKEYLPELEGLF